MYCKIKTDALLGAFGLELPYSIFYPLQGKYLEFYPEFIEALNAYFSNTLNLVPTRAQQNFIATFSAFAIGGADNADAACAALDTYLSTLTGVQNG